MSDVFTLEMEDSEGILHMDWLGRYMVVIYCEEQIVVLRGPEVNRF